MRHYDLPAERFGPSSQPTRPLSHLYLWYQPNDDLDRTLAGLLGELSCPYRRFEGDGSLQLGPFGEELTQMITGLGERLSAEDAQAIRALTLPVNRTPSMKDMSSIVPLRSLISSHQVRWLSQIMRFTSHFQPIVHANATHCIYGYEALLRAYDPDGRPVPPARMFSCAKDSKMLGLLDQGARTAAIEHMGSLPPNAQLFINCCPSSLEEPQSFLRSMIGLLNQQGRDPSGVVLEITESEHIKDISLFKRHLELYRKNGFRIALDDVGSGYSSLNLIHLLRPDFVKIDMGLVRDVHRDSYKSTVTSNMLTLARQLGTLTIAEGVEDLGELTWLQIHGADYVQGYLLGMPAYPPILVTHHFQAVQPKEEPPAAAPPSPAPLEKRVQPTSSSGSRRRPPRR